ncbi:hypothetical protein Rhein_3232 [Rheinheimera sp. A13L]|uniref:hypothetical protein n=1 Tax=Rheinheimera sp. A13L TaxID=506534 RepID=UPI00021256F7|nr:hypothetical protein [Rheinheimera sp. A13L]EGM76683.1 hypothetical protein Rhein_3232 [Rheinheimera sp. A13L]
MKLLLGVIALVADLLGIVTFILSGQVNKFWTATWLVMLISLALLLSIAMFFLNAARDQRAQQFLPLASGVYALLSCIAIISGLHIISSGEATIGVFFGIAVLIVFPAIMALVISEYADRKAHRPICYLYAATGILAIIGLMFRYMDNPGFSWALLGEAVILAAIGVGFVLFAEDF